MPNIKELDNICTQIRRDIVRMVHANNSGHPGGSLGCTEFFITLYFHVMKHDSNFNMDVGIHYNNRFTLTQGLQLSETLLIIF